MGFNRSFVQERIAAPIERAQALDRIAEPLQEAARRVVPEDSAAKELLSGTWLGHPLHPVLTDVVVGAWTSASILDLLGERGDAADELVAAGVAAALPAALSGWSDWAELRGGSRRVGTVHAVGNVASISLQALSLLLRRRERRAAGTALSLAALAAGGFSAWLGGHLSFGRGVGVDQTVFEDPPTTWTSVIDEDKLAEGEPVRRSAQGTGVLLVRHRGEVHALVDRCSHRGCSLSEGSFDGSAITCPCHGSRFGVDGRLLRGPATASQPVLETRVRAGRVEVRAGRG
ncbi:MAG TPA: Rieske (2Fe-2S) protein [Gaiellaceae bacterium]